MPRASVVPRLKIWAGGYVKGSKKIIETPPFSAKQAINSAITKSLSNCAKKMALLVP